MDTLRIVRERIVGILPDPGDEALRRGGSRFCHGAVQLRIGNGDVGFPVYIKKPHAVTFRHSTRLLVLLCFLRCQTLREDVTFDYILSVTRQLFDYSHSLLESLT